MEANPRITKKKYFLEDGQGFMGNNSFIKKAVGYGLSAQDYKMRRHRNGRKRKS